MLQLGLESMNIFTPKRAMKPKSDILNSDLLDSGIHNSTFLSPSICKLENNFIYHIQCPVSNNKFAM